MLSIQKKISYFNFSSRNGTSVIYIILHYTGNKGDTAKNNVDYFYGGNRNASAHYFVDDSSIWQCVEESNAAWAVGDGKGLYGIKNQNSISIEMCCNSNGIISEKTENNALELVKYLQNKYNISNNNVVRHYDASRKLCPNWSENNWSRWWDFKNKLLENHTSFIDNNSNKASNNANLNNNNISIAKKYLSDYYNTKLVQLLLNCLGWKLDTDGVCGNLTANAIGEFQDKYNLGKDFMFGVKCFEKAYVLIKDAICKYGKSTLNQTKLIQHILNLNIDGIFGINTRNAVIKYQESKGILADGIVGANTWSKLLGL